jgi:ankyrin repeat protein
LVNCGSKIDNRQSIFGEAPIHKAILSEGGNKQQTLKSIIEDCNANVNNMDSNGWSALHHAAYIGDLDSASSLLEANAKVNAYSN